MTYDIAVIGLGFVGTTLAAALNRAGAKVLGVEPREEVRDMIRAGVAPFREPGLAEAMAGLDVCAALQPEDEAPVYILCVGTPRDDDGALAAACREVAAHMQDGALVIVRSTVRVGTTRALIEPILKASGKHVSIAVCPERTVEGDALNELTRLPQIVGAETEPVRTWAANGFSQLGSAIAFVWSWEAAETAKLLANAYRDTQFAFANEVARICDHHNVSAREVIDAANWNYPRCNIARPGMVGGPCLEKDSWLLLPGLMPVGSVIATARTYNEMLPDIISMAIYDLCRERKASNPIVAVLGAAFKGRPETDDVRGSPGCALAVEINTWAQGSYMVDPVAADAMTLDDFSRRSVDVIVIANNHPCWAAYGLAGLKARLRPGGFVYDTCWTFDESDPDYVRFGG